MDGVPIDTTGMGPRVAALARGEWVQVLVPGFSKGGITITELMLDQVSEASVWQGWSPRVILHHTKDGLTAADVDEVPAVALLELERRVEGTAQSSTLWARVKQWLTPTPSDALRGYVDFSPEVWMDREAGKWYMPFLAALGGELPLQRGLAARTEGGVVFRELKAGMGDKNADAPWSFTDADYTLEQLFRASAAVDGVTGNPHTAAMPEGLTKGACHLRHHAPTGAVYLSGVNAARSRLSQTDIDAAAKNRADAHLTAHLRDDFGRADAAPILGEKGVTMKITTRTPQERAARFGLAETVAAGQSEGKIWDVLMAFDDAVRDILSNDTVPDKSTALADLVSELGTMLGTTLTQITAAAVAARKEKGAMGLLAKLAAAVGIDADALAAELKTLVASSSPEALNGAAAAPPASETPPAAPPAENGTGDAAALLKQINEQISALGQRLAAVEARVDQLTQGGTVPAAAKASKTPEPALLTADLTAKLRSHGVTITDDADEAELVAAVQQYADEHKLPFSAAYNRLLGEMRRKK